MGKQFRQQKKNPSKARQLKKEEEQHQQRNSTSSTSDLPSIGASLSSEADVVARGALHQHPEGERRLTSTSGNISTSSILSEDVAASPSLARPQQRGLGSYPCGFSMP